MATQNERLSDAEEAFRTAVTAMMAGLWVGGPGIIVDYNAALQTVSVQPAIKGRLINPAGTISFVTMPLCVDVPVFFLSGGGFSVTTPVAEGDECFIAFADRCIDSWWQNGGVQPPAEYRIHDLSDGFAFIGFRSNPRALANVSTTALQIRSDNYTGPAGTGECIEIAPGKISLIADEIVSHGRVKNCFDAGGTGFVYQPAQIDTYTDGVTSNHHNPTPPEVPT
jgi:hypothetical protein